MADMVMKTRGWLKHTGWVAPDQPGTRGELWRYPGSDFLAPVPHELPFDEESCSDWQMITNRIAMVMGLHPQDVADMIQEFPDH